MVFYEPGKTDHGLPRDPFKACVIPRPIGWISTFSPTSPPMYNLAPFSQFNNLTFDPPYVMFSSNQTLAPSSSQQSNGTTTSGPASTHAHSPGFNRKDTVHNAESTGYFCWQLATYELRDAVNKSAEGVPYGVDEFERAGLEKTWSRALPIKIPLVAASPIHFECAVHSTLRLPGNPPMGTVDIVVGRVLAVHINDDYISPEGKIDIKLTQPIARLGYYDYTVVRDTFEMKVPGLDERGLGGLEGNVKKHREMKGKTSEDIRTQQAKAEGAQEEEAEKRDGHVKL